MLPMQNQEVWRMPMRAPRLLNLDLVGALLLCAIGLVSVSQMGEGMRNWVFPRSLTYILFIVAAVLIVTGVRKYLQQKPAEIVIPAGAGGVIVFALGAIVYVFLINVLGFWIPSFLVLVVGTLYLSSERGWRAAAIASAIALGTCVGAYVLFTQIFYVALPQGG